MLRPTYLNAALKYLFFLVSRITHTGTHLALTQLNYHIIIFVRINHKRVYHLHFTTNLQGDHGEKHITTNNHVTWKQFSDAVVAG